MAQDAADGQHVPPPTKSVAARHDQQAERLGPRFRHHKGAGVAALTEVHRVVSFPILGRKRRGHLDKHVGEPNFPLSPKRESERLREPRNDPHRTTPHGAAHPHANAFLQIRFPQRVTTQTPNRRRKPITRSDPRPDAEQQKVQLVVEHIHLNAGTLRKPTELPQHLSRSHVVLANLRALPLL